MSKVIALFIVSLFGLGFLNSCAPDPNEVLEGTRSTTAAGIPETTAPENPPKITPFQPSHTNTPPAIQTVLPQVPYYDSDYPTYPPLRTRSDTWLKILGTDEGMAGTSIVRLPNNEYAVAVGFTPGLDNDFGIIRFGAEGYHARRYRSDRPFAGSLQGTIVNVQALNLGGGDLSLVLDNVWLPEVGTENTIEGWQVMFDPIRQLALTDLLKIGNDYFLSAAVAGHPAAHLAILKVNAAGKVEAALEYPQILLDNHPTFVASAGQIANQGKLFLNADRNLVTSGYLSDQNGSSRGVVLWLDQNGEVIDSVTVTAKPYLMDAGSSPAGSYGYQDLEQLPDGDLLFVQNLQLCPSSCIGSGAFLTRLSASGEYIWSVGIASQMNGRTTFIRDIQQDGDNLIVIGGSTDFASKFENAYNRESNVLMISLSQAGRLNWLRSVGGVNTSMSGYEFKSDLANSFLLTGDGRMIIAGTSSSFGSHQVWEGPPYLQRFDALVGVVDLSNGGINGASQVLHDPDNNKTWIWVEPLDADLGRCTTCEGQAIENISLQPVTYVSEDLTLVERDLDHSDPADGKLKITVLDSGRELISSRTFLSDPKSELDLDQDGIDQEWENAALDLVRPLLEIDNGENWLENLDAHDVAFFGRVHPYPSLENPEYILFQYAVTWSKDYGAIPLDPIDFAIKSHRGDIELTILAFRVKNERSLELEWVYTSAHDVNAHKGVWHATDPTCNRGLIADTGYLTATKPKAVGSELMCESLKFLHKRVWLQVGEDKHALYPSKHICEIHANLASVDGDVVMVEKCGWDGPTPAGFEDDERSLGSGLFLFDVFNIGEPGVHLVDDLYSSAGWKGLTDEQEYKLIRLFIFENERIYSGNVNHPDKEWFCGGVPGSEDCVSTPAYSVNDELPELLLAKIKKGPTTYRVSINTYDELGAGTDSLVKITLYGKNGEQFSTQLDGSFESDDLDVFHIGNPLPGYYFNELEKIGLRVDTSDYFPNFFIRNTAADLLGFDGNDLSPNWGVGKVTIENKVTGKKWIFSVDDLLEENEEHTFFPDAVE